MAVGLNDQLEGVLASWESLTTMKIGVQLAVISLLLGIALVLTVMASIKWING